MTVSGYDNENLGEIIIDKDCTRLKCGHALHSKCMIEGLQSYRGKCLVCNVTAIDKTHLSYEQRIQYESRCLKYLSEIKRKSPEVKEAILDCNAFRNEFKDKVNIYNKKIKEYCESLKKEMNIAKYRKDYFTTRSALIRIFKSEVAKDSIYRVALQRIHQWKLERWLCGRVVYLPGSYRYSRRYMI